MRRSAFLVGVLMLVAANWVACVGDDPGSSSSSSSSSGSASGDGGRVAGERFGPCFPNKTCNPGLECRDGEICLEPNEPKPDGGTGGDGAVTTDADTNDAGIDTWAPDANCPTAVPNPGAGPACPEVGQTCAAFEGCCFGTTPSCSGNVGNSCASGTAWQCDTSFQCLGPADAGIVAGNNCCAELKPVTAKQCTSAVAEYTVNYPAACQFNACASTSVRLCKAGETCDGAKTCQPIVVYRGGRAVTLGACL
jgi:hypothetical protein